MELVKIVLNRDVVAAIATAAYSQKVSAWRQLEITDSQSICGAIFKLRSLLPGVLEGALLLNSRRELLNLRE
mgnify:CR=1 FL=1